MHSKLNFRPSRIEATSLTYSRRIRNMYVLFSMYKEWIGNDSPPDFPSNPVITIADIYFLQTIQKTADDINDELFHDSILPLFVLIQFSSFDVFFLVW